MITKSKLQLLQQYHADFIIRQTAPYVAERRKSRIEQVLEGRLKSIELAIELPADIHNALAAVRSCEVFGVTKVHIIQANPDLSNAKALTRGAFKWVNVFFYDTLAEFITYIQSQGLKLMGAFPNGQTTLSEINIDSPVCLLLGNENKGLSTAAQQACHGLYRIPMFGMTESLNLSVAAAISLYDLTQRKRQQIQQLSDLTLQEKNDLRAQYYLSSVDARFSFIPDDYFTKQPERHGE